MPKAALVIPADSTNSSSRISLVALTSNLKSSLPRLCWPGRWDTFPNSTNQTSDRSVGSPFSRLAEWDREPAETSDLAGMGASSSAVGPDVGVAVGRDGVGVSVGTSAAGVAAGASQATIAASIRAARMKKAGFGPSKYFNGPPTLRFEDFRGLNGTFPVAFGRRGMIALVTCRLTSAWMRLVRAPSRSACRCDRLKWSACWRSADGRVTGTAAGTSVAQPIPRRALGLLRPHDEPGHHLAERP